MRFGFCLLFLLSVSVAFAGSAGIRNGGIRGTVLGDGAPLSGVYVIAVRQSPPEIMRTATSLADGSYVINDLPLGKYIMGFSKFGYKTITTETGNESQQTAVGSQIMVFIESGRAARAPRVNMEKLPSTAPGDVNVRVVDGVTGEPINHANLLLGPDVGEPGEDGNYRVRLTPQYDEEGNLINQRLVVNADGYDQLEEQLTVPGGATTNQTIVLMPRMVTLSGVVKLDPTLDPTEYNNIEIVVEGVPSNYSQGQILNNSGLFEVQVPASNGAKTRQYNVRFYLNGHKVAALNNVIAPRAGVTNVTQPVQLDATSVPAGGQIMLSDGSLPTGGGMNMAVIVELGQAAPINGGSFSFNNVPIGRPLNIRVTVRNPNTGAIEQGDITFTASSGSGNFSLPMIVTTPVTR